MKQCPNCNYSNQDFDTVCNNCGSPLNPVNEPGTYGMNPYGTGNPPMPVKTNGMAIASMVLGIVAVPLLCCWFIGVVPAVLAIIFGFLAKNNIKSSYGAEKGDGMAIAGIVLGFVAIGFSLIVLAFYAAGGFSSNQFWEEFREQMENISRNANY